MASNEPRQVWVCTSGTEYESSGVDAVYADFHGARSWLQKERRKVIRDARTLEREIAEAEGREPDYDRACIGEIDTRPTDGPAEGFEFSDRWWRITPWRVTP